MTRLPLSVILVLGIALLLAQIGLGLSAGGIALGGAGYSLTLLLLHRHRALHPFPQFGPANIVTLGRAALACLLASLLLPPTPSATPWIAAALGAIALLADGLDGWLARQTKLASPFGARFDMETDAALILTLALLAALFTPAGPWIALSGCLRYLFVAAMRPWPWLAAPLPPRPSRRVHCVIQAGTLVVALLPIWPDTVCQFIAAMGLLTALWSFGSDIVWLFRHRSHSP